jgi:hypothetical protein
MRIRITKRPTTPFVEGCDTRGFRVGDVYDLNATVASYFVVAGYAILEMRSAIRNDDLPAATSSLTDRRS